MPLNNVLTIDTLGGEDPSYVIDSLASHREQSTLYVVAFRIVTRTHHLPAHKHPKPEV